MIGLHFQGGKNMEENLISILQEEINDNINNFQEILKKKKWKLVLVKVMKVY